MTTVIAQPRKLTEIELFEKGFQVGHLSAYWVPEKHTNTGWRPFLAANLADDCHFRHKKQALIFIRRECRKKLGKGV